MRREQCRRRRSKQCVQNPPTQLAFAKSHNANNFQIMAQFLFCLGLALLLHLLGEFPTFLDLHNVQEELHNSRETICRNRIIIVLFPDTNVVEGARPTTGKGNFKVKKSLPVPPAVLTPPHFLPLPSSLSLLLLFSWCEC